MTLYKQQNNIYIYMAMINRKTVRAALHESDTFEARVCFTQLEIFTCLPSLHQNRTESVIPKCMSSIMQVLLYLRKQWPCAIIHWFPHPGGTPFISEVTDSLGKSMNHTFLGEIHEGSKAIFYGSHNIDNFIGIPRKLRLNYSWRFSLTIPWNLPW